MALYPFHLASERALSRWAAKPCRWCLFPAIPVDNGIAKHYYSYRNDGAGVEEVRPLLQPFGLPIRRRFRVRRHDRPTLPGLWTGAAGTMVGDTTRPAS
jgi:hypothetical protein